MDSTETRQLIGKLYEVLNSGDRETLASILAEDVVWEMPESIPKHIGPVIGRERVVKALGGGTVREYFERGTFNNEIYQMMVDGPFAVVQSGVSAKTKDGRSYRMEYCWVYTCAEGKITSFREYLDTYSLYHRLGNAMHWDEALGEAQMADSHVNVQTTSLEDGVST